jgi:SAM-dependent methyltransferase
MNRICPACGCKHNALVFENRFRIPSKNTFYSGYDVVECDCGMIYADDLPSQSEFDAYYQAQSKKSSRFEVNGYKEPVWYVNIHKSASDWLNNHIGLSGKKVLDAGCFSGDLMRLMDQYGAECYGYDPSATGIIMSENLGLNVSLAGSFCSSSYFGKKFDLVTLSHVIEHILDHKAFFEDLDNALTDDSLIYIEVPDLENFNLSKDPNMLVDQRDPMLQFNAEHINFFTRQSVLAGLFKRKTSGRKLCYRYLNECKLVYETIDMILSEFKDDPVYIWGAGGNTQRSLIHTKMKSLNIKAFIDNNDSFRGATLIGKPIITPLDISEEFPIIICSLLYMDDIAEQIRGMNLRNKVVKLYES